MTRRAGIWPVVIPWMLFAISAIGLVVLFVQCVFLTIPVGFAGEQVEIFEQMRQQSFRTTDAPSVAGYLAYTVSYYPSGTKQATGSTLDRVVERSRAAAIREMIGRLRTITGEDLGDDPQPWINKYDSK